MFVGCQKNNIACNKSKAVRIALKELERRRGGDVDKNIEVQTSYLTDRWFITIWSLPKTPGGFVSIEVSNTGHIIDYQPGN